MMKRNVLRGLQALMCCIVLLLACSIAAVAAGSSTVLDEAARTLDITECLNGQSASNITSNLKALPTTLDGGISVQWQVLNSAMLASDAVTPEGKVNRPAYGAADAAVILRATLSNGTATATRDLYLIVAAEGTEEARTVITRNAGFEAEAPEDEFAAPEGWLKGLKWKDSVTLSSYANVSASKAYSGKQSLRITANGKMASVQNSAVTTAREGFTYTLGVMAYTESNATNPSVSLKFWDNEGLELTKTTITYTSVPGARGMWKNLSVSAVAPAGTVMVTAELDGGTVAGETYFDDVRLREWPIAANGEFELGTAGWTTEGTVADGKLTLAAGQTAVSMTRSANRGVTYYLSLNADGGKAALRFVNSAGRTLKEYSKDMTSGLNAFFAYAPANTAGVQVVLTGAMTADNVKITRSATGTGVTDGDFECSDTATDGVGTPWELTNATIASGTGVDNSAGLTVNSSSGKATSTVFPVEDGKGYIFSADVKGTAGKMEIVLYNAANGEETRKSVSSKSNSWNPISYSFDQLIEALDYRVPEHSYAKIILSGNGAVFDNVRVYSTSTSVSNASMENTKIMPYGTFPYNWAGYGSAATYMANQDGQYTEGVKGLAVELFGLGEGGVRSSMLENIKGGKAYEATVNAKGSGAKLFIEFWDKDFNKLDSEFVTIGSDDWQEYSVKATAHSDTVYASLSVGGEGVGLVCADEAAIVPVVRSIGTNVQLFLDNWLIADSENVQRTFYQGEKQDFRSPDVFTYPSVHWDEKEQVYKMWHLISGDMRYRTSKDGINWGKATVCKIGEGAPDEDYPDEGDPVTGSMVHIDDDEPDPSKRYKAIIWNNQQHRINGSYDYYSSADGITWKFEAKGIRGQDVVTMVYDEVNDEYIVTYKNSMTNPQEGQNKRTHSIAVSKDLINWSEGVRMYTVGTPADTVEEDVIRTDGYGNGMYPLGDSYVGLNWRFLLQDQDSFVGQLDSNLLFSRDLTEDWQRLRDENGKAVLAIPRGPEGQEDDAQIYTAASAIQMGDETWWWWYGLSGDHSGSVEFPRTGFSSAVKWRRNGFASMDFGPGGTLTTEQFTLVGDQLHLNASGNLTVELLDANGAVAATGTFSGDSVDKAITWDKSLADQKDKVVSLRFTGSNAKLYSLQQVSANEITVLPSEHGSISVKSNTATAGTKVNVTVTPDAGYELKTIYVNGEAIEGTTFTMPTKDVTVTADFWPEGTLWREDFDGYKEGTYNLGASDSKINSIGTNYMTGTHTQTVVDENGTKALKVTAAKSGATNGRAWLKTNISFDFEKSYIIEARFKGDNNSSYSDIRLQGVNLPRTGNTTGTGNYDLRFDGSEIWFELPESTNENILTGDTKDEGAKLYLYTGGTANNVANGAKVEYTPGNWYTVKIYVNGVDKTVLTELYDDNGLLGSRTLNGVTFLADKPVTMDHNGYTSTARETYWDYITVKGYKHKVNVGDCVNGSVAVSAETAAYGSEITVTATPAEGYELKAIYVNGEAIPNKGTTFTMPGEDVEVTAEFWPEGSIWHEDFDNYANGPYNYNAAGSSLVPRGPTTVAGDNKSAEIVDGVLNLSLTGEPALGKNRIWLATRKSDFNDSYTIEFRFKSNNKGNMTNVRLTGVNVDENNYQLRFYDNHFVVYISDNNQYTSAATYDFSQWHVVKIHVSEPTPDAVDTSVIMEIFDDNGTLLDTHSYTSGVQSLASMFSFEPQSTANEKRIDSWDYITVKEYKHKVNVGDCVNGSVAVSAETAAYGSEITVTATPAEGYELKAIYVNGEAIEGTTFTMPNKDVTVTADFWPEGTLWREDFDGYTANSTYDLASPDTALMKYFDDTYTKGNYSFTVVKDGDVQALKVTATGTDDDTRTWVKSKADGAEKMFSGSYIVEARLKCDDKGSLTQLLLQNLLLPSGSGSATYKYDLRFTARDGIYIYQSNGVTSENVMGTEVVGSTKALFLYNGDTKVSKSMTPVNEWYTVRVYVNDVNGTGEGMTVLTELYDKAGTLIGSRTLSGASQLVKNGVKQATNVSFETLSVANTTRETYWDYITVKEYKHKVNVGDCVNGSVAVSAETAAYGSEITVTATPAEGYELKAIYVNGTAIPNKGTTFTMPAKDVTVTADFEYTGMYEVGNYKDGDPATAPEKTGYEFAGWYSDSSCTTPYTEETGKAYAKFVSEKVLSIIAQVTAGTTTDSDSTNLRLMTSVDGLQYREVGFKLTKGGETVVVKSSTVYSTILSTEDKSVVASDASDVFGNDESAYFMTYILYDIPKADFSTEITVVPYWITMDGTEVLGEAVHLSAALVMGDNS